MSRIEQSASLAELVADRPWRAQLFERLRLDYCCGGAQTLADACTRRGLDADTVRELLEALDQGGLHADSLEDRDWRHAGIGELCDHIVSVHHDGLRRELPRIVDLLATVVRIHGESRPKLAETERVFAGIRDHLERHLGEEERVLFPACRALETDGRDAAAVDEALIERHEAEHSGVGEGLVRLRGLAGDYDASQALCGTHRSLLGALHHFESDLHQHVHEENNVLFPRVRELAGNVTVPLQDARPRSAHGRSDRGARQALKGRGSQPLPLCCQAWVVEAAHSLHGPSPGEALPPGSTHLAGGALKSHSVRAFAEESRLPSHP